MAFRFKLNQPVKKDVRRLLLGQIEKARIELGAGTIHPANIHEARKCLKRIRSVLRLVRPALGDKTFRREAERYRQIAELLSPLRDRQILLETVEKLEAASAEPAHDALGSVHRLLKSGDEKAVHEPNASTVLGDVRDRFGPAAKITRKLKLGPVTTTSLMRGLEHTYRKGRRAFSTAYATPDDEAFHDVRKSIQHHCRHLQLMSPAWPDLFAVHIENARTLAQLLGDDHDLSVLVAFVSSQPDVMLSPAAKTSVIASAYDRQRVLRAEARPYGQKAFAMNPKELHRTIGTLWTAAAKQSLPQTNGYAPLADPATDPLRDGQSRPN
jgi:CHAD domain-containing protein